MARRYSFGDAIREIDEGFAVLDNFWGRPTFTLFKGELYDPEEYELTPKKKSLERHLRAKEQELQNIEGIQKHYEERHKKIKEEVDELITQINKKSIHP